jgi:ATP phosphoribosyltransferase
VRVVLVRASDVPTYVEYGGADLGVTGLDTLIEHGGQGLYQPLDLNIAKCRMSVAVRASDVPTYVEYGGADLGVTGLDTLIEHGGQGLYQPLDLNIAKCRMSVAVRADYDYASAVRTGSRLKVATKYTAIARDFFATKGVHVDMIKLYGSMELAPLTGLADAIVDLVSTGNTLKANHLVEVERIMDISSRLVVNQAALKLKQAPIRAIIDAFAGAVKKD